MVLKDRYSEHVMVFAYGAFTLYGGAFQLPSANHHNLISSAQSNALGRIYLATPTRSRLATLACYHVTCNTQHITYYIVTCYMLHAT